MYEGLVKAMRICAGCTTAEDCRMVEGCGTMGCNYELLEQAAEAIEELQKVVAFEKALAECWEGQAENCRARFQKLLDARPKWISVEERLPIMGDDVICFGDNGTSIAAFVVGDKWSALPWFFVDGEQETGITHWMPLPEPPKEE